ncbi:MAG: acyl-CoA dehydrogenase [Micrococcales bacterium 73-15]|uniref:acyl-CoA dehydrogenase family protein n=1 Tax=Salana multivorans TaxID=120377 RepID=UPI0009659AA1|nr:acyl-CoA dehydrogenase [Salana multivorans]OJX96055.1 MAG: acyl-CoA dehydrogenase [Micrococcales bacterium 73-15]
MTTAPRSARPTSTSEPVPSDAVALSSRARAQIADALDGRWRDLRRHTRDVAAEPGLVGIPGLPMPEHRARVLACLADLASRGEVQRAFPTRLGGGDNPGGNIAAFEELLVADPSLQIKAGVQWGLFGAAVLHLGTQHNHDELLPDIMSLEVPGAFAMTEIGHGSDVASIGTTATYDPDAEEFVIHTPFRGAWKEYLGNAALHGVAAVVFAQLVTGGVNHGVHAFYVPLRDTSREPDERGSYPMLPGVRSEDDGYKGGLNGIDNGRLAFDHVRVPRTNLLDRYGRVDPDGTYSSPIASPGRRFFTMLSTLVQGRVSLGGASAVASKMGLAIAVRYAEQRRQFPGADGVETVLMDYGTHRRRLLPLLARTYAVQLLHNDLLERFHGVFAGERDTDADREDLETLAAAAKPLATWHALETLQTCREACGGAGYMAANRIVGLRADLDVYVTFEGDNTVLLQLVGKRLLTDYGRETATMDVAGQARWVAKRAGDMALYRTPLRRASQSVRDWGSKARSASELRDPAVQRELLEDRVETMIEEIALRLRPSLKGSPEEKAAAFDANQAELVEAARAHGELMQWEAFTEALDSVTDPDGRRVLTWLRDLFGLHLIESHLAWYVVNGRLSAQRARTVTSYIERLLLRLRPYALQLVEVFGYGDAQLRADIATPAESERQAEAMAYHAALRESGDAPVSEKDLLKRAG